MKINGLPAFESQEQEKEKEICVELECTQDNRMIEFENPRFANPHLDTPYLDMILSAAEACREKSLNLIAQSSDSSSELKFVEAQAARSCTSYRRAEVQGDVDLVGLIGKLEIGPARLMAVSRMCFGVPEQ